MTESPRKVLFTASTFPRWPGDPLPDFVWQQVRHVAAAFPSLRVFVLAPHDAGAAVREVREGVEIRRFRYFLPERLQRLVYPAIWPNLTRSPWLIVQVPFLLVCELIATLVWIRKERFALVYSHWFMPQGVACGLAALLTGTPHAFTSHSSDVRVMRKLPLLGPWLVRLLVPRARAITVVSQRSRAALASFFDAERWSEIEPRVRVLPMGLPLGEWRRALALASEPRLAGGRPAPRPLILFVGRLVEKKGVGVLLEAMALEPLAALAPSLVVMGDGPLRGALEARAGALGLAARVHFVGFLAGAEKAAWFGAADAVALPSVVTAAGDAEGVPVVLAEALAAGRTCVASDASGAEEVIEDGRDGFLVRAGDAGALAAGLARALRLGEDERGQISERARRKAAGFDWEVLGEAHVRHLIGIP